MPNWRCGAGVVDRQRHPRRWADCAARVPDILAIGDAASYRHWFTGADVRLESVQNATDHARLAARTITGHADSYASVPWFWSDIGDMKLQMVGLTAGSDRQIVSGEPAENRFSVFHYAGDRLIGIESVNRPADHMLGRKMMGAGFFPGAELVAGGGDGLKAAFAAWQQARLLKPAVPRKPVGTFSGSCLASTGF